MGLTLNGGGVENIETDTPKEKANKAVDDTHIATYAVYDAKTDANSRVTHTQEIHEDARGSRTNPSDFVISTDRRHVMWCTMQFIQRQKNLRPPL